MGTEPTGRSVEDRGTDPAGALVLAVVDLLGGVDDLLVAALGVLEDLLLAGRVVHALEGLLDVDGAHHDPGLPRPERAMRGYRRGVHAATIAGLLADPTRLKVVAALALGARTIEQAAEGTGLPLKDVALAARRLGRAGLVRRDRHELELLTE